MSCSIFKSSGLGAPVRPRSILVQSSVGARPVFQALLGLLRWVSGCENVVLSASWPIRIHQSSCTCFCWKFSLNVLYFYGIWSHQVSRSKKRRVPFRKVWLRCGLRSKPMLQGASHLPTPESNESEVANTLTWLLLTTVGFPIPPTLETQALWRSLADFIALAVNGLALLTRWHVKIQVLPGSLQQTLGRIESKDLGKCFKESQKVSVT